MIAAAAALIPAAVRASPCSFLTPEQIKAVVSVPVNPGLPSGVIAERDEWDAALPKAGVERSAALSAAEGAELPSFQ